MVSVCLNMIVKNESGIIKRCLASVKGLIDYWVIVDTGSDDGTQEIVLEFMRDVPGELHERPWVDFAHNRNQALALAKGKGDYLLFIDADETLEFSETFKMPSFDQNMYLARVELPDEILYYKQLMIDNRLSDWSWRGVVHEEIERSSQKTIEVLQGVTNVSRPSEGCRGRDPHKYLKDARLLEEALQKDPDNTRYAFFLAQSYQVAQEYRLALPCWERRAAMGGSEEEVYYALYAAGRLQLVLEMDEKIFLENFAKAHHFRPSRAEPLFWMGRHEFGQRNYEQAYRLAKRGLEIPLPSDNIYVERWVYDYGLYLLLFDAAFELKYQREVNEIAQKLALNPHLSPDQLAIIRKKLVYKV